MSRIKQQYFTDIMSILDYIKKFKETPACNIFRRIYYKIRIQRHKIHFVRNIFMYNLYDLLTQYFEFQFETSNHDSMNILYSNRVMVLTVGYEEGFELRLTLDANDPNKQVYLVHIKDNVENKYVTIDEMDYILSNQRAAKTAEEYLEDGVRYKVFKSIEDIINREVRLLW